LKNLKNLENPVKPALEKQKQADFIKKTGFFRTLLFLNLSNLSFLTFLDRRNN
jgi:hypothetical protein